MSPSLLARGPLAALLSPVPPSSPSPVQPSPVPDTSIRCTSLDRRQPAPEPALLHLGKSHHPPDCCHLCCPPPPTHSPTSRPASKQPCSVVLSCRSATAAPRRPHLLCRPGQLQITHSGRSTALLLLPLSLPPAVTQPGPNVRQPPAVRLDSRRALIIRPSLFGLDPALPTRIPSSLDIIHGDHSLLARPPLPRDCADDPPRPPPESPSHRRDPPPPHARPSAIAVGAGDCACCEKSRPRPINRPPLPPPSLLHEPAHATLRAQDRRNVHTHAAEGRR